MSRKITFNSKQIQYKLFELKSGIIVLLLLISGISTVIHAQCDPCIDSVQIVPEFPQNGDSIFIIVKSHSLTYGAKPFDSLSIDGNTIHIYLCISSGPGFAHRNYTDTFSVGVLAINTYNLKILADESSSDTICLPTTAPPDTMNISFEVLPGVGVEELIAASATLPVHFHPNPVDHFQNIEINEETGNLTIDLYSISGRFISTVFNGSLSPEVTSVIADFSMLPAGVYFYRVTNQRGLRNYKVIKR